MSQELIDEVLLANAGHRVGMIQPHDSVSLINLRPLHLHRPRIVWRGRPKLNLAHTAIGHLHTRTPLWRRRASRIENGGQSGVGVTVDTTIPLNFHLPLDAAKLLRDCRKLVKTLVVLT